MMSWIERIFHEPVDPEVGKIKNDLEREKNRHNDELGSIRDALVDLERTRKIAEGEIVG
jgi:hypothetical protein